MVKIINSILAIVVLFGLLSACHPNAMESDFNKMWKTFNNADEATAFAAEIAFLKKYTNHVPSADKDARPDWNYIFGVCWLEIYSIYYCRNDKADADYAMQKAIFYNDRDPDAAKATLYLEDKRKYLHHYIFENYLFNFAPKWFEPYRERMKAEIGDKPMLR